MTLKKRIGWRSCLIIIGLIQTAVIGCGFLLRPIVIRPAEEPASTERDDDASEEGSVSLKDDFELENEQTKASIGSEDSGITSLSTSCNELPAAAAAAAAAPSRVNRRATAAKGSPAIRHPVPGPAAGIVL